MENKRIKRLITCLLVLTVMVAAVTVITCSAESYPNVSNLDSSYLLPDNQQIFHRPNDGFVVASTNSYDQTIVTMLDASGNPDETLSNAAFYFNFVYVKAAVCGEFIYIAAEDPNTNQGLLIYRLGLVSPSRVYNKILNVSCDFNRGFNVDADGNLFLVTVPYGNELNSSSPFWVYSFQANSNGAACSGTQVPDSAPSSSEVPSAAAPSSASNSVPVSSSESSVPSSSNNSEPNVPDAKPYVFSGPITVETLQQQLDSDGRGATVRVTDTNGSLITNGSVGTGSIVEVLLDGRIESRIIAVVPGDLTGTGTVTAQDNRILYEHVTNQAGLNGFYFQAADLNNNSKVDPGDMLKIKSMIK